MIPQAPVQFISQPAQEQPIRMMEKVKEGKQSTRLEAAFMGFGAQLLTSEEFIT